VGKGQGISQPLPVVAMGSIPHIYRRAAFPHRATLARLPQHGGVASTFFDNETEFPTTQQSESVKTLIFHRPIIGMPDAFIYHASKALLYTLIQLFKLTKISGKMGMKVIYRPAYYSFEFLDEHGVKVMRSPG